MAAHQVVGKHPRGADDEHVVTTTLERLSPGWAWVRANFSLASVLAIAGIVATAGGYVISLKTRVVVLEHEVTQIVEVTPNDAAVAALHQEVADHEQRLERLETDWDDARQVAGQAPPRVLLRRMHARSSAHGP